MGNLALGRWNYFRWTININRTTGSVTPTHCATVPLVSSDHQGRATAVVHRIDLCPVAKHQLQSCDILSKCSGVQRGPSGKHSNILIRSTTTLNQRRRRFYTISATEIISEIKNWKQSHGPQPHLPLASLVLIIWIPTDSSSRSAAPLWPFILWARRKRKNNSNLNSSMVDIRLWQAAAAS